MGLLEFMGISKRTLNETKIEKPNFLTEKEILSLRGWIELQIGEERAIQGKIIASGLPDADGYSVISWGEGGKILKSASFYSAEQIEERAKCNRNRFLRDLGLVRIGENTYSLSPEENRVVSSYYPKNFDYSDYAKRLRQDELEFRD